ncbi:MAG: aldo/keto reductase [Ignavibacteria bacterium]|nr:aldo/keto reductase [Ignavibacteria bacterium]
MNLNSKIGLGTVQFGLDYGISNKSGRTNSEEVSKILQYASENDIDTLDTASAYGEAEKILGENNLDGFRVISKFMPPNEKETIRVQLQQSLEKLKQKNIYGYLAHRPMDVLENPNQWDELLKAKEEKLVTKIGFSLNKPEELTKLLEENFIPDLIQVPYNYFDNRFQEQMIDLHSKGCEIHTRSAFLQGLFFMESESLSSHFDEVKPEIKNLQNSIKNLSGSLLKFVCDCSYIDKVIIGVENLSQLKDNLNGISTAENLPVITKNISENILMPSLWQKN